MTCCGVDWNTRNKLREKISRSPVSFSNTHINGKKTGFLFFFLFVSSFLRRANEDSEIAFIVGNPWWQFQETAQVHRLRESRAISVRTPSLWCNHFQRHWKTYSLFSFDFRSQLPQFTFEQKIQLILCSCTSRFVPLQRHSPLELTSVPKIKWKKQSHNFCAHNFALKWYNLFNANNWLNRCVWRAQRDSCRPINNLSHVSQTILTSP